MAKEWEGHPEDARGEHGREDGERRSDRSRPERTERRGGQRAPELLAKRAKAEHPAGAKPQGAVGGDARGLFAGRGDQRERRRETREHEPRRGGAPRGGAAERPWVDVDAGMREEYR